MSGEPAAVIAHNISKSFGAIKALDGVSLSVPYGRVLGLLGPNGAGKTTLVRILTTLLPPDSGSAQVAGHDVIREADTVRSIIGLAGQYAAVDANLTGQENLEMVGRLYHLGGNRSRILAQELLERFGLTDAAHRLVRTYSGGMRRRLDLAASLVARPRVLFLDEPTVGLDPRSRFGLWDTIQNLVEDGTTVLLTTQYMEEADHLADAITLIDNGRVIAEGTAQQLKERCGGARLSLRVADRSAIAAAATVISDLGVDSPQVDPETGEISLAVLDGASLLAEVVRQLDTAGIAIADIALRQPTLDDVFLSLTGHAADAPSGDNAMVTGARSRIFKRRNRA